MELNAWHYLGMVTAMLTFFFAAVYSSRRVRRVIDFSVTGRRAGPFLVMGTILGTLIGGASTVGTAQLAYLYGFSAWWFTLGGGLGCLVIALFLVGPMRKTRFETIPRFISSAYGPTAGIAAAFFVSLGMFVNIMPQIFSGTALLSAMLSLSPHLAAPVTVLLTICYVVFGGAWGTGLLGLGKIILTALAMLTAGLVALHGAGGPAGLTGYYPSFPWFSLFGRGVNTDLAAAFALVVGVLSSQIYFQGVFSGRSSRAARQGVLLSAFLAPLIGLGGILVGLQMRMVSPGINPAQVLPLFILTYLPALPAGIVLATLLFASVGTGAGLALGVSTMLNRDVYCRLRPQSSEARVLLVFRILIVVVMALALLTVLLSGPGVLILNWSYLSLGLRGAAVCFPLLAAIFLRQRILSPAGTLAVIVGPLVVLVGTILPPGLNPLYFGLAASFLILVLGLLGQSWRHHVRREGEWRPAGRKG